MNIEAFQSKMHIDRSAETENQINTHVSISDRSQLYKYPTLIKVQWKSEIWDTRCIPDADPYTFCLKFDF